MEDLTVKQIIKKFFNVDLPISGGSGNSIVNAIKIESSTEDEGVQLEYQVLDYIHQLGNKSWRVIKQELLREGNKAYDKLTVEVKDDLQNYHNYYFDITDFHMIE